MSSQVTKLRISSDIEFLTISSNKLVEMNMILDKSSKKVQKIFNLVAPDIKE